MSLTVRRLLEKKGHKIFSVSPETTIYEAIKVLVKKQVGVVVVVDEGRLVGVLSERDIIRRVVFEETCTKECPVKEVMTRDVVSVIPEDKLEKCMMIMTEKRFRHLAVKDGNELLGIISIGDLVKFMLDEKETLIKHFEKYIYEGW